MMTKYELRLIYNDGYVKTERADLPNLMAALSIYFNDNNWTSAEITNGTTGEVIARWKNYDAYGITCED